MEGGGREREWKESGKTNMTSSASAARSATQQPVPPLETHFTNIPSAQAEAAMVHTPVTALGYHSKDPETMAL